MNIVIAPDSFKGSLTSIQAANIMEKAILDEKPHYLIQKKPMADGGEGTIDSFLLSTKGKKIQIQCTGPLGFKIATTYAIVGDRTAIIECARIAGLTQVPHDQRNPDLTTTYGMGEVIIDALNRGCTSLMIGLGGSATNDGGLGMLLALGMKAYDQHGKSVGIFGKDLKEIEEISFAKLDPRLKDVQIQVASDVENPLCGHKGASVVYGPQKGATAKQVQAYDGALDKFSSFIESELNHQMKDTPGAGAAGGLGFALLTIGAHLVSGAKLLADAMNIEEDIQNADLVLTGEGLSDEQTLYGKAPGYIASLAAKYDVPVVLISGGLKDVEKLRTIFTSSFSIVPQPLSLSESMEQANLLLYQQTNQIIRLINTLTHSYQNKLCELE